ncbi:MAG TPA: ABC transporter permease [Candidatus Choladocola avistercoris]|nr:ABC transporter permease [Candidatus Choladocola avistercoris]
MKKSRDWKLTLTSTPMILIYVMVVFCVVAAVRQPAFLSPATLVNLCRAGIFTMCFAICEMVVIVSGGIDVSFPAVGCVAMYVPMYLYNNGMGVDNVFFFFGVAMLAGLVFGVLNGFLVSYLKLPPLIATLATSSVASGGLIMLLGTREFTTLPPSLEALYSVNLFTFVDPNTGFNYPLTILILVPVILCLVMAYVMRYTMLGRGLYAIGGDSNAARIAGFNVRKLQFIAYIFCGVMASATAMIYTTLMHSSTTTALMGEEMIIIAACVVGGCRLTGGHGGVGGTVLGVLLITLVQNNLNMLGIPTSWQTFAVGLVLLLGAVLSSVQAKRISKMGKI